MPLGTCATSHTVRSTDSHRVMIGVLPLLGVVPPPLLLLVGPPNRDLLEPNAVFETSSLPPPPLPPPVTLLKAIALIGCPRTTALVARDMPHIGAPFVAGVAPLFLERPLSESVGTRPYHSSNRTAAFTRRSVAALFGRSRAAESASVSRPRGTRPSAMRTCRGGSPIVGVGIAITGKPRAVGVVPSREDAAGVYICEVAATALPPAAVDWRVGACDTAAAAATAANEGIVKLGSLSKFAVVGVTAAAEEEEPGRV